MYISSSDLTQALFSNNILSPACKKILSITHIKHDGTLESVVQATQKAWLRKPNTERWQMNNKFENLQTQLVPFLKSSVFFMKLHRHRINMITY